MRIEQFCIQSHLMPPYLAGSLYLLAVNSLVNFPDKHCICRHKYKIRHTSFEICRISKNCPLGQNPIATSFFGLPERIFSRLRARSLRGSDTTPWCHSLPLRLQILSKKKKSLIATSFFWPARKDLNLRPSESESDALSSCATGRY